MHNFRTLKVWQKARIVIQNAYKIVSVFPREEMFALSDQIRRASVSIAANIAEGCGRNSKEQFRYFLNVAQGSAYELETLIIVASDLGYSNTSSLDEITTQIQEVQKMLASLLNSLGKK